MVKYFEAMLKVFEFFPPVRNWKILIGLCKEVFMNHLIMLLDRDNKIKVSASFFYLLFRTLMREKQILAEKVLKL